MHKAFAVLATPASGLHLVDPLPGLKHAADVADEACVISGDATIGVRTSDIDLSTWADIIFRPYGMLVGDP